MPGVGRGNGGGGGGETEVAPPPEGNPYPEGLLDVTLTWPRMSGFVGPAWPRFCFLNVGVGGERIDFQILPSMLTEKEIVQDVAGRNIKRYVRAKVLDDIKNWELSLTIPMQSDWTGKSLDIFVERIDRDFRQRRRLVVTRGGPHTSSYTAVIGRARLRLLDALGIGDLDKEDEEEEAEDNKKRRRRNEGEGEEERKTRLLWGTVEFDKTVPLLDWELPEERGADDGQPRSVVRGTVHVRMCLRRLAQVAS